MGRSTAAVDSKGGWLPAAYILGRGTLEDGCSVFGPVVIPEFWIALGVDTGLGGPALARTWRTSMDRLLGGHREANEAWSEYRRSARTGGNVYGTGEGRHLWWMAGDGDRHYNCEEGEEEEEKRRGSKVQVGRRKK